MRTDPAFVGFQRPRTVDVADPYPCSCWGCQQIQRKGRMPPVVRRTMPVRMLRSLPPDRMTPGERAALEAGTRAEIMQLLTDRKRIPSRLQRTLIALKPERPTVPAIGGGSAD